MDILIIIGITTCIISLIFMAINVYNNYSFPVWAEVLFIIGIIVGGIMIAFGRYGKDISSDKYYITNKNVIITDTVYSSGDTLYIYQLEYSKIKDKKVID